MAVKKSIIATLAIFLVALLSQADAADMNPLTTDKADTIGKGNLRYTSKSSVDSLDDGTMLYHFLSSNLILGISEKADLILNYGGMAYREGHDFADVFGPGDLTVGLKFSPVSGGWGSVGFLISTKLPNADDKKGLGTDVQDFHLVGLYTASLNRLLLNLNAGFHIIGDSTRRRKYHYLFAYGAGFEYMVTDRFSIVGDISGTTGGDDDFERSKATLGFVSPLAYGWEWGVTGSGGLTSESPDWSASFHISKSFNTGKFISNAPYTSEAEPARVHLFPFPLSTEESMTVRERRLYTSMSFGVMSYDDDRFLYTAPSLDLRYGLAKGVDIEVDIPYSFLRDSPIYGDTDGLSDMRVGFKISPWQLGSFRLGVLNEIKMPASNDRKGLGRKEMDYTALFLTSATFGKFISHLNLGLAIEGNPERVSSQNDFFIVGSGAEYAFTDWMSVFGNFSGKIGFPDEYNSYRTEGGFRFLVNRRLVFSISGGTGFEDIDPDWTANFGISVPIDF